MVAKPTCVRICVSTCQQGSIMYIYETWVFHMRSHCNIHLSPTPAFLHLAYKNGAHTPTTPLQSVLNISSHRTSQHGSSSQPLRRRALLCVGIRLQLVPSQGNVRIFREAMLRPQGYLVVPRQIQPRAIRKTLLPHQSPCTPTSSSLTSLRSPCPTIATTSPFASTRKASR